MDVFINAFGWSPLKMSLNLKGCMINDVCH